MAMQSRGPYKHDSPVCTQASTVTRMLRRMSVGLNLFPVGHGRSLLFKERTRMAIEICSFEAIFEVYTSIFSSFFSAWSRVMAPEEMEPRKSLLSHTFFMHKIYCVVYFIIGLNHMVSSFLWGLLPCTLYSAGVEASLMSSWPLLWASAKPPIRKQGLEFL